MDTYFNDNDSYKTVSGIIQPRADGFLPHLFILLRAQFLRFSVNIKIFAHGTETMKLCQEIVCPVDSLEDDTKNVE
jgi:hypothetical protein